MDLITILIGFVTLFLLVRHQDLADRLRDTEEGRRRVEIDLAALRTQVAELASTASAPASPPPIVPVATPPATAPAMAPAVASPARVIAPAHAPTASPARRFNAHPDECSTARPRAAQQRPAASAGPSLAARILDKLGLSSGEGGGVSRAAMEAWLEGRLLAVVGGIALILGAAFFLSLAFSKGWITEPMRVLIGLAGGALAIALGELAFLRLRGVVGHVLLAVGLAVVSLSLFAATRLFGLIPPEAGVATALLVSIVAAVIAIRHDSELVAAFGLVSVLLSPPLLGASPTPLTILFLSVALIGTTAIALFRTWVWLPPLAFLLAAPQVASSALDSSSVAVSLLTIAGFWLLNTIAAGGEEIRHPTDRLRPSSVTLLLATTAFTLWAGMTVLNGEYLSWRGAFVAAIALADLYLAFALLARFGDRNPFGLVVAATGVAAVTMAVPIQLGAPWVPVAWAAEAVALAWLAVRYRHPYAAAAALALGAMALLHLVVVEYPIDLAVQGFVRSWPFLAPEGITYLSLMAGLLVAAAVVPVAWIRVGLGVVAILTTAYVLPFELDGPWLVAAWSALTVAAMAGWRFGIADRLGAGFRERHVAVLRLPAWATPLEGLVVGVSSVVRPAYAGAVVVPMTAAIGHLVAFEYPAASLGRQVIDGLPYASAEGAAVLAVLVGLAVTGLLSSRAYGIGSVGVALIVVAYTLSFEIDAPLVMVPWGVLTLAAAAIVRRVVVTQPVPPLPPTLSSLAVRVPYLAAAAGLFAMAIDALLYAPLEQLVRSLLGDAALASTPFLDERTFAFAILAITLGTIGWVWRGLTALTTGTVASALVVAWLLPFEIRPAYALAGWAVLATGGFVLARRVPAVRELVAVPAIGLIALGLVVAVTAIAPPSRLVVDATTVVAGYPILTDATVALVSLALALAAGAFLYRAEPIGRAGAISAAVVLLYAISVGVVDVFQQQVGTRPLVDLQREAQLALSLVWSALGGIAFVVGLRSHLPTVRRAGLALLGLATAKVFIVDLASLDVAYRVLSLVGLGVLLLVSAVVYARQQQREARTGTHA